MPEKESTRAQRGAQGEGIVVRRKENADYGVLVSFVFLRLSVSLQKKEYPCAQTVWRTSMREQS